MEKSKNSLIWVEAGYDLFAAEGMEGIQVERLARILSLNKSGFYHYFGDLEGYYVELRKLHEKHADLFLSRLVEAQTIDPDFLQILLEFKVPVMFHMQLTRIKNNKAFYELADQIDAREDVILSKLWSNYLGIDSHPHLAIQYFAIIRDKFYARISFQNFTFQFLQDLLGDAKTLINQLTEQKALEPDDSLR